MPPELPIPLFNGWCMVLEKQGLSPQKIFQRPLLLVWLRHPAITPNDWMLLWQTLWAIDPLPERAMLDDAAREQLIQHTDEPGWSFVWRKLWTLTSVIPG